MSIRTMRFGVPKGLSILLGLEVSPGQYLLSPARNGQSRLASYWYL